MIAGCHWTIPNTYNKTALQIVTSLAYHPGCKYHIPGETYYRHIQHYHWISGCVCTYVHYYIIQLHSDGIVYHRYIRTCTYQPQYTLYISATLDYSRLPYTRLYDTANSHQYFTHEEEQRKTGCDTRCTYQVHCIHRYMLQ